MVWCRVVDFGAWDDGCGEGRGAVESVFHGTARTACAARYQRLTQSGSDDGRVADYELSCNVGRCGAMPTTIAVSNSVIESNRNVRKYARILSQRCRLDFSFSNAA